MLARTDGQTVGHRATSTRVVMADGSRMAGRRGFVREALVKGLLIETAGSFTLYILPLVNDLFPLWDANETCTTSCARRAWCRPEPRGAAGRRSRRYDEHGRDLPWRRTRDPYAILVSEVMAQQTQIARVLERYERWLARWPTAQALAAATPAEVLTEWVGLGYNQRALRLHAACRVVARDGWPPDAAGLRALPGVGPYTAAAVASFAFGERVPASTRTCAAWRRGWR